MILNASHEITLRGLPSEILDAYVRYKKGSRAIVSWLVQFGPTKYKGSKTLPIKELASLAKSVTYIVKDLPEVIHFHFRETIAARKRLSQFFRNSIDRSSEDIDTVNHEHFTTSLAEIYDNLCHQSERYKKARSISQPFSALNIAESVKNHYACLPVEDSLEHFAVDDDDGDASCDECLQDRSYQCHGPQPEVEIENDEMSLAIETATVLERTYDIFTAVEVCWNEAAEGRASFVSAAGITNVAWAALREQEHLLRNDEAVLNIGVLHQRCCLFADAATDPDSALAKVHALLESLAESESAINHYADCHKLTIRSNCPSCVQKPGDYVQQPASTKISNGFHKALMDNMLHLMAGDRPTPIILNGSPIFPEIGYLLTHRQDQSTRFRCVIGLHLLATAYGAYLIALPKPSTIPGCRISALRLSRQSVTLIDSVLSDKDSFPCRCPQTLAFHLSNLRDDMDSFSKHKKWDLYFQSPWVAGTQIIEMLDMLSYYGMRLLHYRHHVGSILHSYNVLVQLAGLKKISVLEHLCDLFEDIIFPSGRPKLHFKNSWSRFIGARLKFKKGPKNHRNDRDNWCMAVPAHAARNAAGLGIDKTNRGTQSIDPRCDHARIDPMMKLKQLEWRADLSPEEEEVVLSRPSTSTSTTSQSAMSTYSDTSSTSSSTTTVDTLLLESTPSSETGKSSAQAEQREDPIAMIKAHTAISTPRHPLSTLLSNLNTSMSLPSSTTSDILPPSIHSVPIPRAATTIINHIQIFHTCTNLINAITAETHAHEKSPPKHCICFAHTLLTGADRITEGRKFGGLECWKADGEREVVDVAKKCLEMEFGGAMDECGEVEKEKAKQPRRKEIEDFVWLI